jgi:hypothetical protein
MEALRNEAMFMMHVLLAPILPGGGRGGFDGTGFDHPSGGGGFGSGMGENDFNYAQGGLPQLNAFNAGHTANNTNFGHPNTNGMQEIMTEFVFKRFFVVVFFLFILSSISCVFTP